METLASPRRKEPSINKNIRMVGKKNQTCPFLLSSECFHPLLDAEPWFLCSRRLERREGNICISPRSVTGTSIIAGTMGSAPARLARAASLQRSHPDLFLSGLGAGCGDQVTVPKERLASPVLLPCAHMSAGVMSRQG